MGISLKPWIEVLSTRTKGYKHASGTSGFNAETHIGNISAALINRLVEAEKPLIVFLQISIYNFKIV